MKRLKVEKKISYKEKVLILAIFPLLLFFTLLFWGRNALGEGFIGILTHPGILVTDYIAVGGYYQSLLNVFFVAIFNLLIIYFLKIPINGLIFAGYFVALGFSFFGKSIINILPIYLGGFFYSRHEKVKFRSIFAIMMFATGLAPVVSFLLFNKNLTLSYSLPFGISMGMIIGFIITPLSSHMLKFHDGYNLYNIGFTIGVLGTILASILKSFGLTIEKFYLLSYEYDFSLKVLLSITFTIFILIGYVINNYSFSGYDQLMASSGRVISDYILTEGYGLALINAGVLGLLSVSFVNILGTPLNGPLVAGIFTVFGFGAFGKHPVNTIPIVLGILLASMTKLGNYNAFSVALTGLFGTTLAPISGVHGPFLGIIAGALHFFVVSNVGIVHGGMNLYNNGFSGGLVAGILVPIIHKFDLGEKFNERIY